VTFPPACSAVINPSSTGSPQPGMTTESWSLPSWLPGSICASDRSDHGHLTAAQITATYRSVHLDFGQRYSIGTFAALDIARFARP